MEESVKELEAAEPTEVEEVTTEVEEIPQETVEFSENDSEEIEKEEQSEKNQQTKEENAKYATARRKAEAEMDIKVKEAYEKGKTEAYIGKMNPYTHTVINDKTDVDVYEQMYELEKQGKDPINDFAFYVADKQRQVEKEKIEQQQLQQQAKKDIEDFAEKYPNININDLLSNEMFCDYADGKNKPLIELYENFDKFQNSFRNKAVDVAKQTIANAQATPGSLGNSSEMLVDYQNMSKAEFEKMVQRAKDGELR